MRRIFILGNILILCCLATVNAEEQPEPYRLQIGKTYYKIYKESRTARMDSCDRNVTGDVVVPSEFKWEKRTYTVTSVARQGFRKCKQMTGVTLPKAITNIGEATFYGCESLTHVELPQGLVSIGRSAFEGCSSLTAINIPASVSNITGAAFRDCVNLSDVTLPANLKTLERAIFDGCIKLQEIKIPSNVRLIDEFAFYECSNLKRVELDSPLIDIKAYAFDGCTSLEAFTGMPQGKNFRIDDGVLYSLAMDTLKCFPAAKIGPYEIPASVNYIADCAFAYCSTLKSLTLPSTVKGMGLFVFHSAAGFDTFNVAEGNKRYAAREGAIYSHNLDTLIAYPAGRQGSFVIPANVKMLTVDGFGECTGLTSVDLPAGITVIDTVRFMDCTNLRSVRLPRTVKTIGTAAFMNCPHLHNINLPNSLTRIDDMAFCDCKELAQVSIPASVTDIGIDAFNGTRLSSIAIPASVRHIGSGAFFVVDALTDVFVKSTTPISIEQDTFYKSTYEGTLCVPKGCTDVYRNAPVWGRFKNIVEPQGKQTLRNN